MDDGCKDYGCDFGTSSSTSSSSGYSGEDPDDELSGPLISAYPSGPACTVTVSYCTINETNSLSYLLGAGGGIRALVAATNLSSNIRGSQLIVYGTIADRNIVGIKPYTRHISLTNASNLTSGMSQGMWSSVSSGWTWLGIGISALADTFTYANGGYTTGEFAGALGFDVVSSVISAAIGGAVSGATVGFLAGATAGMGIGAVPGLAAGIILGALVGAASYYAMNIYKDDVIAYVGPGIDLALQANSNPNPYSGILYP